MWLLMIFRCGEYNSANILVLEYSGKEKKMAVQRSSPYIWVTWLSKLLVGENSCEWAAWFKAHYTQYEKPPNSFDFAAWQVEHTALLNALRHDLQAEGKTVLIEKQNHFTLRGSSGIILSGIPDLVCIDGEAGTIYDVKTGQPQASHHTQVMIYMYALPLAFQQYKGMTFDGMVVYQDKQVAIPASVTNDSFKKNLVDLIRRVGGATPTRKVPSAIECGFCDVTRADCPERVEVPAPEVTKDVEDS